MHRIYQWVREKITINPNRTRFEGSSGEYRYLWRWQEILAIILLIIIIVVLGSLLLYRLFELTSGRINSEYDFLINNALFAALEAIAILLSVYLIGIRRNGLTWQAVGLTKASRHWHIIAGLLGLLILPSIGFIALLIQLALGLPPSNPQLEFLLPDKISIPGVLIMLVFGGFILPIAEEILFRGLLYSWLRQTLKLWPAIIISSAAFGMLHGEISIAVATFLMGIILAWIYERSSSLWPAISIHIINNSIKLFILYLLVGIGMDIPALY